ncbi:MAG: SDR family NAD(P)-dependent oxidoreductase [Bacteroidia bacterium]|nr:SDR family NAD(P)-dependent oxidoreductase [Bacteroidia bacterium]
MCAAAMTQPMPAWRHVLITGAAQGLGRALSELCARAGMTVSMLDVNAEVLAAASDALRNAGGRIQPVVCDVRDGESVRSAFEAVQISAPAPDALICCAAIGDSEWKRSFSAEVLEAVLNVNVLGIARCMEHCLPLMHAGGGGDVVLISSLLDARGYPGTASYSTAKAALRAMADSARVLLRSSGIRVVLVRPGFMRTAMTEKNAISMPGMLTPEQAAERILRGVAKAKAVISFPRWLAILAELARLLPRTLYEHIVRMGMVKDGEAEDLHYSPARTHGGVS